MTLKPVKALTHTVFIFILTQLTKLVYNKSVGEFTGSTVDELYNKLYHRWNAI